MSLDGVRETVDAVYRTESRRVLATLIRLLGDFDAAEEAVHDAFAAALEQWGESGVPANPRTWLVSAGRFKAIDRLRRGKKFDDTVSSGALDPFVGATAPPPDYDDEQLDDDRLRLIFTCCHPAIAPEAQIALTLREVCGLTTEAVARAFLTPPSTLAQRIVRAKNKIRDAQIPYEVPSRLELPQRLDAVLHVVYLVFNEGYSASSGSDVTRPDLSAEAIRLGRLLVELLPEQSEVVGLLGLMLLHDSRRAARVSATGDTVLLEEQDRALWSHALIVEGTALVVIAIRLQPGVPAGPYALQAAIAAVHAESPDAASTDWQQIVRLYDLLLHHECTPVVELNRAAAIAMRDGPAVGLELIDAILARGELGQYHLAHAARGELCRRLGRNREAAAAYDRALALVTQDPERRLLERRLREVKDAS